jgi:hypothetical protein
MVEGPPGSSLFVLFLDGIPYNSSRYGIYTYMRYRIEGTKPRKPNRSFKIFLHEKLLPGFLKGLCHEIEFKYLNRK